MSGHILIKKRQMKFLKRILHIHCLHGLTVVKPCRKFFRMRLMLAVLHTVYSRADENGNESPLEEDNEDEALYSPSPVMFPAVAIWIRV